MKIKRYIIDGREIHILENAVYIAVCWNCDKKTKKIIQDGITYSAEVDVRKNKPYINFISLKTDNDGKTSIEGYTSVDYGINSDEALFIVEELQNAVEYIESPDRWLK